ncbi:glycosyltransferase family 4 protein [Carboxylicivirga mesophila]|uniref:Glycosyltransferase family 4 protein n=1 Tax=Carboxylicivirga mesophila TaxID=1166478 RepID=A0ABS5K505_9BACT|nr:glycosyltransferase family 4 protein [Carboxylicivirga mesophila]MBS2210080.1 glycosyltransferase family 4 protein [Carboxylicivirga mesophila]
MRLLFINSIGKKKWGGGEKWMVLAAKELMKKGHHVIVGCRKHSILEYRSKSAGLPVVNIDIYSDISLRGGIQLRNVADKEEIDLIIGCQNKDVRVAGLMAKLTGGPLVISRQGVQLLHKSNKYKWSFLPLCDGIITNTYSIKKEYDSYGWWGEDYVKVIHNGIPCLEEKNDAFDLSSILPVINGQTRIVVSTGRLAQQKGFQFLIEAAQPIVKQDNNVHFIIAGKGKLEASLKKQIVQAGLEQNVHLIGFQANVHALLKVADIFVLPSLYEGMPNALMEALANGVPSVSTDVNGVSELMKDEEHGYIVSSGNVSELSEAICKLLADKNLGDKGRKAREHVTNQFSVDKMVHNLELHLQGLIANKVR